MNGIDWLHGTYPVQKARERNFLKRFWSKVDVLGPDDCWLWLGRLDQGGYGRFRVACRYVKPGLVAWQLYHNKKFPQGMWALHRCDNRPCVNPLHIFPGTAADNSADMVAKGRSNRWIGKQSPNAKLTRQDVRAIREMSKAATQIAVARKFGVHPSTVSLILSERIWQDA